MTAVTPVTSPLGEARACGRMKSADLRKLALTMAALRTIGSNRATLRGEAPNTQCAKNTRRPCLTLQPVSHPRRATNLLYKGRPRQTAALAKRRAPADARASAIGPASTGLS